MKTYKVKMKHDAGAVTLRVRAASYANAIFNACAAERAPESAVESCGIVETPRQQRRAVRQARGFAW